MLRRTLPIDAYFDIETETWDIFVVGGFYDPDTGFDCYTWDGRKPSRKSENEAALADRIINFGGGIWAHNGGRYDTLWVLNEFLKRYTDKAQVNLAGQRIVCLSIGDTEIRDSAALIPMSLEKAAELGGHRKHHTGLPCVCGTACGGYCSITRQLRGSKLDKLIQYLRFDCLAGFDMLRALSSYAESRDIDLCSTVGASAWRTAKRWANLPDATWAKPGGGESRLYTFARQGYFGGRTQVFKIASASGYHIDVNSAYVNALKVLELPTGKWNDHGPKKATSAYSKGMAGIYQAEVFVPESLIPPLPVRGRGRLYYPFGRFDGVWAGNELRYAEEWGCSVLAINRALVWEDTANIFRQFSEETWRLRDEAGTKTALGTWLKWFGNSATGKLAQHPLVESVEINPDETPLCPGSENPCDAFSCVRVGGEKCCRHGCSGYCGRYVPLDPSQRIWSKYEWRVSGCAHVHWAAYLTAHQRVYLHRQIVDDGMGGRTAVYSDTDSLFSESMRERFIGNSLGDWKLDGACGKYWDFVSLAPKTYAYIDIMKEGVYGPYPRIAKAKGIYKPEENWEILQAGRKVKQDRGVMSFKSALGDKKKPGIFKRKNLERSIRIGQTCKVCGEIHVGDRILKQDLTYPMSANMMYEHDRRSVRWESEEEAQGG